MLDRAGIRQVGLWRLGAEDPGLWSIFGRTARVPRSVAGLTTLSERTNVDIEGPGEILRITALPTPGKRKLTLGRNRLIANVDFVAVPRPFTITRTGYRPGAVALTFDDGPDPRWTPRILDILKEKQAPATFFIVGENALTQRGLLAARDRRKATRSEATPIPTPIWRPPTAPGHCSSSMPPSDCSRPSQAATLKLFRAPFFGDAEPTTADEARFPCMEAQNRGYLSVGLHVDSEDWQRPGVATIVRNVGLERHQERPLRRSLGNAVQPQHHPDARWRRRPQPDDCRAAASSSTSCALAGTGSCRCRSLPGFRPSRRCRRCRRSDHLAARVDLAVFDLLGFTIRALGFLFAVAIALGVARAVALAGLGLLARQGTAARAAGDRSGDASSAC